MSPEEQARNRRVEQELNVKQRSLENTNFRYLVIFEKQMREHKQAQKEFYDTHEQEEKEADANRPAMFRK